MRSLLALLPLLALTHAADPRLCTSNGPLTPSDFTLEERPDNQYLAPLATIFRSAGKNVSVSTVLDSANRDLSKGSPAVGNGNPSEALAWNSGDFATSKWVPQGISGSWDADASGTWDDRESWLVSWHNEDDTEVRISFVDRETNKYRHVYLVYPEADDDFKALAVHAGGIVWYGDFLYVVDTTAGVRVFDMTNIWEVEIGDHVGKNSDGSYSAAGYRYVLPQIRYYKWVPGSDSPFRFSWISLDRSDNTLLIGEFIRDAAEDPIRFTKYPVDTDSGKLKTTDGVTTATFAYCVDFERMQGGFSYDNNFFISRSNGNVPKTGDLYTWSPGESSEFHEGWFMAGDEDLSYNEVKKEWYTVTEYPDGRYILAYAL
ncbi:hypothetical protein FE257_011495 [Aspergillus nanangensis]|uniref:Secreted protein n=1 Tax=Aspergillus nanangensis TaxID=2582783 RepID=A0AAD4CH38_ASPNN|nr:hypothetical protein FE257_011495 [Aspergillus nanangensis]